MKIRIKKDSKLLGILEVDAGGHVKFSNDFDQDSRKDIENVMSSGVAIKIDRHDSKKRQSIILKKIIRNNDPLFSLALRDHLKVTYETEELHSEVDEEIISIISKLPQNDEDRVEVEKKLPKLSYLERTFLLRELRKTSA